MSEKHEAKLDEYASELEEEDPFHFGILFIFVPLRCVRCLRCGVFAMG